MQIRGQANQTSPQIMSITPEKLFETRWLGLYRIGTWDFAKRPNSEACVGILPLTDEDEVILIEQFRIPVQKKVIEIPAGLVGDEEAHRHEPIIDHAARELLEETGYRAGKIEPLLVSPTSAGMTCEFSHLFLATQLVKETEGGGVGGENIITYKVPRRELREWLKQKEAEGYAIDFKIHASLWAAGL
jgi:ADP-ribose pyrophosphatase